MTKKQLNNQQLNNQVSRYLSKPVKSIQQWAKVLYVQFIKGRSTFVSLVKFASYLSSRDARKELADSIVALNSWCDGAHAIDGQGFNKFDHDGGRTLAETIQASGLPETSINYAKRLAIKYQKQLINAGFDIELINTVEISRQLHKKEIVSLTLVQSPISKEKEIIVQYKIGQREGEEVIKINDQNAPQLREFWSNERAKGTPCLVA